MGCGMARFVLLTGAIITMCVAGKLVNKRAEESEDDVLGMPSDLGNEGCRMSSSYVAVTEYYISTQDFRSHA
jgi:hypothetical protein